MNYTHKYPTEDRCKIMSSTLQNKIDGNDRLENFKLKLLSRDRKLLKNFDIVLTDTELEIRGGIARQQWLLYNALSRIQKIATSNLNVEVAIYGSIFSTYATDKVGCLFSVD